MATWQNQKRKIKINYFEDAKPFEANVSIFIFISQLLLFRTENGRFVSPMAGNPVCINEVFT